MSFFKKRNSFAIAVMLVASVLFIGCARNEYGKDLVKGKWVTGGNNGTGSWDNYVYGLGEIKNFSVNSGEVSWEAVIPMDNRSNEDGEEEEEKLYSGAFGAVYFNAGFLKPINTITIEYSSNFFFVLQLGINDPTGFKSYAPYQAILPATNSDDGAETFVAYTFDLGKIAPERTVFNTDGHDVTNPLSGFHFKQIDYAQWGIWEDGHRVSDAWYTIDLSEVTALLFGIPSTENEDRIGNIKIRRLKIQ